MPAVPLLVPLALLALVVVEWWITLDRVKYFPDLPEPLSRDSLPSVCLCMPVRNEVLEVGTALDSWLQQDLGSLFIVVVDDGSSDGSMELLQARARAFPHRLQVIRNEGLPPGWLGKNHALHLAVQQSQAQAAEWLLFADGDIHARPDLLRRVFACLEVQGGDFLALWPAMITSGFWERLVVPIASLFILWMVPSRRVQDPSSRFAFAAGAFTLVRRGAYNAIGGHASAPMLAIDDVGLAVRLKQAGFRNALAVGAPHLWYRPSHGFMDLASSLRKNMLGLPGMLALAPIILVVSAALFFSPLWLAWAGHAWAGILLWLLVPPLIGTAQARFSKASMDWVWAFWPLAGIPFLASLPHERREPRPCLRV